MPGIFALLSALLLSTQAAGSQDTPEFSHDIDAFMAKVLEKRDIDWDQFYNYTCRDREVLEFEGTLQNVPLAGFRRKHLWFVRDGYLIRSPVSVNGVEISEEERRREEKKWVESLEEREKRSRGVDRDRFFGFKFEPGNYYYAGSTNFEGREVVIIEYYPESAFGHEHEEEDEVENEEEEDEIEAKMNKVLLVTLFVDPEEHQIVQMTLDNVGFDFLPGRWLIQIGTIEATMTMHQPFGDVWLVRDISAYGKMTTALGDLTVRYTLEFYDYAIAQTSATYRFPPRGGEAKKK
jgi:hypothetical protein